MSDEARSRQEERALLALRPFPPVTSDPSGESAAQVEVAEQPAMPSRLPGKTAHASFVFSSCILTSCGFLCVCGAAATVGGEKK